MTRCTRSCLSLYIVLLATLFPARAQTVSETIVPPSDQVSDFDARLELARVFQRLGRIAEAEDELHQLLRIRPDDPVLLADLADLEAARGHFERSRDLYLKALSKSGRGSTGASSQLRLRYALQARSWGDFYLAEKVLRARLQEHPQDVRAALDLAGVLVAEQQYEAADAQYRLLTKAPRARQPALIGLATSHLAAQDFQGVLPFTDEVLNSDPNQVEALTLRAEALRRLHRYDDAKRDFRRLTTLTSGRVSGWIGLGRIAHAQKDDQSAEAHFRRAHESDPVNIKARYLLARQQATGAGSVHEIVGPGVSTAPELNSLADVYAADGSLDSAITTYRAALEKDPNYFPAQIGLAQTLASAHRYDQSLDLLTRLRAEFPDDAKIMLTLARVLSWSRRYDQAIGAYRQLSELDPADTVPRREMARVATWSNQMGLARKTYAEIDSPTVDQQLSDTLQRSHQGETALQILDKVPHNTNTPYERYEELRQLVDSGELPASSVSNVETVLAQLEPLYRLQKAVWLESTAKWLNWNRKFMQAAHVYRQLIALEPSDEEAWFDLAQVKAAEGLSLESTAAYGQLLELDPLHNLAGQALEREQSVLQQPAIFSKYTFWDENGIGRASDIERQQFQSGVEVLWHRQTQLYVAGDYWNEAPGSGAHADAAGVTLGFNTVLNENWQAAGEWSYKDYFQSRYNNTDTGHANLTFNAWDYAHLTLQYARVDELHNEFGLLDGVQSDNVGLLVDSNLNHYVEVNSGVVWTHYTDTNQGVWVTLAPAFILLDHPHELKLVLRGDYRDTEYASIFEFQGPKLANIVHPYWTPQNYYRGTVILEWRQDLTRDSYSGGRQNYYALRLGGGFDSTANKDVIFEAEWHYDFLERWALEVHGTVDRSPAWNGAAAIVSLIYRF
jgi:tetratricopeptide (TPR) repeat protein